MNSTSRTSSNITHFAGETGRHQGLVGQIRNGPPLSAAPDAATDDSESSDLEVGVLIHPLGRSELTTGNQDLELDVGDWDVEPSSTSDGDDAEGPTADTDDCLGLQDDLENSGDDSPDEIDSLDGVFGNGLLSQLDGTEESADEMSLAAKPSRPGIVTPRLEWSTQPWCEHRLATVFTPRNYLAGFGSKLVATGESTSIVDLGSLSSLEEAPFPGRTQSAALLDTRADRILLASAVGHLHTWDRPNQKIEPLFACSGHALDRVIRVCHCMPVGTGAWVMLATGDLYELTATGQVIGKYRNHGRCMVIESGDSKICAIVKCTDRVTLLAKDAHGELSIKLPHFSDAMSIATEPILAASKSALLVGAREIGAWLSLDNGISFQQVLGSMNMTAATLGQVSGRTYAWLAVFYELEDRTELIGIDCRTQRVQRLASYTVVADCSGPEDDPPERARIDSLYWDASHQKLWAAGCFGLTCFTPASGTQSSS